MLTGTATTEPSAPHAVPTLLSLQSPAPQLLVGKYLVKRVLGEGGMGVVLEATHVELQQDVAIKLLGPHSGREEEMLARFRNEARITARLPAEHVVRVFDAGKTDTGQPYLVMELLAGRDLDAELDARGRLPVAEAVDYVLQACEGLAEAHAIRLAHRDLKPANLFLTRTRDGEPLVKVVDFGIATSLPGAEIPVADDGLCGTPSYMAPEQFEARGEVDARSDQYAIATVLFELVAGLPPFDGDDVERAAIQIVTEPAPKLSTRAPCVPRGLDAAIARALAKSPEDRFPDLAAFALAIAPFGRQPESEASAERVRAVLDRGPATAVTRRRLVRGKLATRIAAGVAVAVLGAGVAIAARPLLAAADERPANETAAPMASFAPPAIVVASEAAPPPQDVTPAPTAVSAVRPNALDPAANTSDRAPPVESSRPFTPRSVFGARR